MVVIDLFKMFDEMELDEFSLEMFVLIDLILLLDWENGYVDDCKDRKFKVIR